MIRRHGWSEIGNMCGGYDCFCGDPVPAYCLKRWPSGWEVVPLAWLRQLWWRVMS